MKRVYMPIALGLVPFSCLLLLSVPGALAGAVPLKTGTFLHHPGLLWTPADSITTPAPAAPAHTSTLLSLPSYTLPTSSATTNFDTGGLLVLGGKFAVVLILLLVCLRILKAVMPGGRRPSFGRQAHMVLHSETVGEKQKVCLLDLQSRIVVVGVSPTGVTPITSINELEEMTMLRARYQVPGVQALLPGAAARRPQEQSFAVSLAAETGSTVALMDESPAFARKHTPRELPIAGNEAAGDPVLGQALNTMRALRHKVTRT